METNLLDTTLETMHGDLTKAFTEELENAEDTWQKLSESKQDVVISRCTTKAENAIRKIALLISQKGFESCTANVEQVTFKDGAKVTMTTYNHEGAHLLADRTSQSVLIIFADPADYLGGGEFPESEPDQKEIQQAA